MPRVAQKNSAPRVADLVEESVHLLRRNLRELVWYYVGTGPFAVAVLYFWSYVTWFAPADGAVAAGALGLAILFGWMKACQHRFAQCLLARRMGEALPRWSMRQWLGEVAAQFRLQASGLVVVPLAAVFGVPFGWAYCYYQTATVLPVPEIGGTPVRRRQGWEQMQLWPAQNHWALAILSGLWVMVFLNIGVSFYAVPTLATQWLGVESIFVLSGWSWLNSTFLMLVAVLTHLLVDPLIKTFYLLRVFHGSARRTGADLRLVLLREKSVRQRAVAVALIIMVGSMVWAPSGMRAAEPISAERAATVPVLDRELDRVLEKSEFRWRLRPLPVPVDQKKEGIIKGFVRSTFEVIKQIVRSVGRWVGSVSDWFSSLFPGSKNTGEDEATAAQRAMRKSFDWMSTLLLASYVLLSLLVGLLVFVAVKVWHHNRVTRPIAGVAPIPAETPDLRDESVEASRLPADGWIDLARQQMAAGEWRLALRALFLATLARHAREGWLSLAKFKTNLDYEIELGRRTRSRPPVVAEFRDQRRQFEQVWYGAAPASDTLVRAWLQQMEERA